MEKQFSFANAIAIYKSWRSSPGRYEKFLNSTTLSAAHPNHQPEPFLSWRLRPRGSRAS
jgi:hypothetical protein